MLDNKLEIKVEKGKSLINVIKTQDSILAMHDQWRWDDQPYWETCSAWIVEIYAHGYFKYGPYKYRKDTKKKYQGTSTVYISDKWIFLDDEKKAHKFALEQGINLEKRGLKVNLDFFENHDPRDISFYYKWIKDAPPEFIQKRIKGWKYKDYKPPVIDKLYFGIEVE